MVAPKIVVIISNFVNALKEKGIRVEQVYLYGSYAYGEPKHESDIDIAVVSPDFGKDRYEEGKLLRQIAWRINSRIEPIPISKESFLNDDWIPLVYEIKARGVPVKVAV